MFLTVWKRQEPRASARAQAASSRMLPYAAQLHDAETGAISLLGVRAALEDAGDELTGRRTRPSRPSG